MRSTFCVSQVQPTSLRALNYSPFTERFRRKRGPQRSVPLIELLKGFGTAWGAVFTRIDCDARFGVHLLSQVDVFSAEPEGRTIRRDSMPHPERHEIKKWQVLLSGAGQMGDSTLFARCIIADGRLDGKYVGPDSVVMTFNSPESDESLYTYAYLLTETGASVIRSCAYGTSIPRVRLDLLAQVPIPIAPPEQMARIAEQIRTTVRQRETYLAELIAARRALEELPEMKEALSHCAGRRARCVSWSSALPSLCAWNLASTGGALAFLKDQWKSRLDDVLVGKGVFNGPRFARVHCKPPFGIDFYSQRDLFLIRRIPRYIKHPGFSNDLLFVPEGSLLVGGQGTLGEGEIFGRVVLVSGRLTRAGFTQHLLRVVPQWDMSALAYAFLSSEVGFRLLRSTGVGTKLLSMRPDLLRQLPFPEVSTSLTKQISNHVAMAMEARNAADEAEANAIRIVENEVLARWQS